MAAHRLGQLGKRALGRYGQAQFVPRLQQQGVEQGPGRALLLQRADQAIDGGPGTGRLQERVQVVGIWSLVLGPWSLVLGIWRWSHGPSVLESDRMNLIGS